MTGNKNRFNIRVYGIAVHDGKILLSHEEFDGRKFTKFPGGGLQWGESIQECLRREYLEETGIEVEPGYLFHVTETVQVSAFYPEDQVIGIYYLISSGEFGKIVTGKPVTGGKGESFEWVGLEEFYIGMLTFPTDREAAAKLLQTSRKH